MSNSVVVKLWYNWSQRIKMKIKHKEDIFSKKIKNKWVILEPNKEYVRELDEVAGIIWEMAQKPTDTKAITKKIASIYNNPLNKIQKDVDEFVKKYIKNGFLEEIPD